MLTREGHDRPLLACGQVLLDMDYLANLVRPSAADLVDHVARGVALLIQCMGKLVPLWSPTMMNGACIAQILMVMDMIRQMQYMQQEMNDCHRLFHCYMQHRWATLCDMIRYQANVQVPLFCYEQEAAMQLQVTMDSIQAEVHQHGQDAMQVASWVKINMRALRQRYAQELERKCSQGTILFVKGNLIQLIWEVAHFDP